MVGRAGAGSTRTNRNQGTPPAAMAEWGHPRCRHSLLRTTASRATCSAAPPSCQHPLSQAQPGTKASLTGRITARSERTGPATAHQLPATVPWPRPSPRPPRRGSDPGPLPEGTTLVLALSTSTSPPASPTTLRRCDPPAAHRRAHSPADRCARKRQVRSPIRPVQLSRESRELQPAPQGTRVIGARVRPGGHLRPNASATTPGTKSRGEAIAATPEREQRWCRGDRASRRAAAGVQLVQDLPQDRAVGVGAAGGPGEHPMGERRARGRRPAGAAAGRRGDAGVAEQVARAGEGCRTCDTGGSATVSADTGFWTPTGPSVAGERRVSPNRIRF